jgi:hypothetical protein
MDIGEFSDWLSGIERLCAGDGFAPLAVLRKLEGGTRSRNAPSRLIRTPQSSMWVAAPPSSRTIVVGIRFKVPREPEGVKWRRLSWSWR